MTDILIGPLKNVQTSVEGRSSIARASIQPFMEVVMRWSHGKSTASHCHSLKIVNTLYPTSKGKPPAAFGFTVFHHWRIKAMETPDRNFGPHSPGLISEITPESEWHRPMPAKFPPGTAREVWTILFGTTLPEEFKPPSLAKLKVLWCRLRADARRLETR